MIAGRWEENRRTVEWVRYAPDGVHYAARVRARPDGTASWHAFDATRRIAFGDAASVRLGRDAADTALLTHGHTLAENVEDAQKEAARVLRQPEIVQVFLDWLRDASPKEAVAALECVRAARRTLWRAVEDESFDFEVIDSQGGELRDTLYNLSRGMERAMMHGDSRPALVMTPNQLRDIQTYTDSELSDLARNQDPFITPTGRTRDDRFVNATTTFRELGGDLLRVWSGQRRRVVSPGPQDSVPTWANTFRELSGIPPHRSTRHASSTAYAWDVVVGGSLAGELTEEVEEASVVSVWDGRGTERVPGRVILTLRIPLQPPHLIHRGRVGDMAHFHFHAHRVLGMGQFEARGYVAETTEQSVLVLVDGITRFVPE